MSEVEEKPRRRRRRGTDFAAPVDAVDPDDVARSEHNEATTKNKRSSEELLRLLNIHHKDGYGRYK